MENSILFLVMRRMRTPLLVLSCIYTVAVVGMTLVPGEDAAGNVVYMDFFHAFYFVSYTGSTIGFGEIPIPFSGAQRMWAAFSMYLTVIAWIYAIGAILALVQDEALRQAMTKHNFARIVRKMREPFYLVCGYGDTGRALVSALEERFIRTVVIESRQERINVLIMENYPVYVPRLCAAAEKPDNLLHSGLNNPYCAGVVALTNDNYVNLHVAITSKLLSPSVQVICRVDSAEVAANMDSFGTDHMIDPFEIFAAQLHTALHFPTLHLLYQCLSRAGKRDNSRLCEPPKYPPNSGLWILCGYGRFGHAVYQQLKQEPDIRIIIIEKLPERVASLDDKYVLGRGTEAVTLQQASIEEAVGIVAGTDDDVDNLSIVMTARALNPDLFVVLRQNLADNELIFRAAHADILMQASQIIADHIRVLLLTPLLEDFMLIARLRGQTWARHLVSQLHAAIGNEEASIWETTLRADTMPAVYEHLSQAKPLLLKSLLVDPRDYQQRLPCVPLLLVRNQAKILLPQETELLEMDDRILWCGHHNTPHWMAWTFHDPVVLEYASTGLMMPQGYVWQWLQRHSSFLQRLARTEVKN